MKTIFSLVLIVGFVTGSLLISNVAAAADSTQSISIEASTLLLNQDFAKIVKQRGRVAAHSGQSLRIQSFSILDLGPSKYVYALLAEKSLADIDGKWTAAGTIVGSFQVGPQGELTLDGVYFKPQEEGPGGASVGNH